MQASGGHGLAYAKEQPVSFAAPDAMLGDFGTAFHAAAMEVFAMTESACDAVGNPCVLSAIPYMSEWDTCAWWPEFAFRYGIGSTFQVVEGPGPRFFNGPKPPGRRPWAPKMAEMRRELAPYYHRLRPDPAGSIISESVDMHGKPHVVYILSAKDHSFPYPTGTSKIWYIGKSSDNTRWPRDRAFNHFFGPDAGHSNTVFKTERARHRYPDLSTHEHLVLLIEGLGSTEATDELEAKLLKSFKAVHHSVPMCNSQSASSRLF